MKLQYLLLICLAFAFTACDDDDDLLVVIYPTSIDQDVRLKRSESGFGWNDYHYNSQNRIDSITAWEGDLFARYEYRYNSQGVLIEKDDYYGFLTSGLQLSRRSYYHYSLTGSLDSISTDHFSSSSDPWRSSTQFEYGAQNGFYTTVRERYPSTGLYVSQEVNWLNNNIVSQTYFDSDGSIRAEWESEHSDQLSVSQYVFPPMGTHPYLVSRNERIYPEGTELFYSPTTGLLDSIGSDLNGFRQLTRYTYEPVE